jgi:pimeloyl-ACP methyl ester carboxylesterase
MRCVLSETALLALTFLSIACAQTKWRDPSKHSVQFVTVQPNVRLEVLDWGGSGQAVVLLAGYGNSAHVFDEFAEKLSETNHVYGITRRGFGLSSRPDSGYEMERLAADVSVVLDALGIVRPVLAGHSYAGKEMTILGKRSDRIAGLIFLDALSDPTYDWTEHDAILRRLPPERYPAPRPPRGENHPSFEEYMAWQRVGRRTPFPESELRATWGTLPNGRMGGPPDTPAIREALKNGMMKKPDYASIRVPALAFAAYPALLEQQLQEYELGTDQDRQAVEDLYAADQKYLKQFIDDFQNAQPEARVIKMIGASHHIFISNQADVLFEMRSFMSRFH